MLKNKKMLMVESKKQTIERGGGKDRIQAQNDSGKKTARERIEMLLDKDSFVEINAFVEHRCSNFSMSNTFAASDGVVTGYGTIDSRLVYLYSQDFTVMGGSLGEMHAKKICEIMDMAVKMGAPLIGINDSGGARIQEGLDALSGFGEIFRRNAKYSGVIPQIFIIAGPCAGGAVYSPAIGDFVFMIDKIGQMFITGPSVVKTVTGEDVSIEDLGGSVVHSSKSGVASFNFKSETECFLAVRKLLTYLPSNNLEITPIFKMEEENKTSELLNTIIPEDSNKSYDMMKIIEEVADSKEFFPVFPNYARNIIIGFSRMGGKTVGVVANQPKVMAGVLDTNSSDKAARFVRFCDCFNIPLITLTDVPGYLPGVSEEYGGIIRHGAKLLYSFSEATVPKINVIVRKAYGGAYIAMNSKHIGADMVFAWPSAEIAVMGPEGAANIIFRKEIKNSENPIETREHKINEYKENFANPLVAAKRGYINDIIEPSKTRSYIISALLMLESKNEVNKPKKHGNIPL